MKVSKNTNASAKEAFVRVLEGPDYFFAEAAGLASEAFVSAFFAAEAAGFVPEAAMAAPTCEAANVAPANSVATRAARILFMVLGPSGGWIFEKLLPVPRATFRERGSTPGG
jgi:hypothetical protein